jgi:hypothetical protein
MLLMRFMLMAGLAVVLLLAAGCTAPPISPPEDSETPTTTAIPPSPVETCNESTGVSGTGQAAPAATTVPGTAVTP